MDGIEGRMCNTAHAGFPAQTHGAQCLQAPEDRSEPPRADEAFSGLRVEDLMNAVDLVSVALHSVGRAERSIMSRYPDVDLERLVRRLANVPLSSTRRSTPPGQSCRLFVQGLP